LLGRSFIKALFGLLLSLQLHVFVLPDVSQSGTMLWTKATQAKCFILSPAIVLMNFFFFDDNVHDTTDLIICQQPNSSCVQHTHFSYVKA
jgi:hypothetical protein